MQHCMFCKIVQKEVEANLVYEDDVVMAILDVDPITDGQTLILPKKTFKIFILLMSKQDCML